MLTATSIRHFLTITVLILAATVQAQVSPLDYGLLSAASGTERYECLRRAHIAAIEQGTTVCYDGIDTLRLDVPRNAQAIPLPWSTDFGSVLFIVTNNTRSRALFERKESLSPLAADIPDSLLCRAIDSGDYRCIPQLREGCWLLEVTDSTPWVGQRRGYSYGHYRQELIRIRDGVSLDRPASSYGGTVSKPRLRGRRTDGDPLFCVGNVSLLRDTNSSANINLLDIEGIDSIHLHHITIVTTACRRVYDAPLRIYSCADIRLDSSALAVRGIEDYKGYCLLMNNCRNTRIRHLYARNPWGSFGTNNMHNTQLDSCDINRFDIHCYGRDVTMRHCQFTDTYNQLSSLYGTLRFDSCRFDNSIPLLIEDSYCAYTPFSLVMRDCWWHITREKNILIHAGRYSDTLAARPELREKHLPTVYIDNLTLQTDRGARRFTLVRFRGKHGKQPAASIRNIKKSAD